MIEEKSCVSKVQRATGSYRFRIEGYSGLSTRIGDSVESPEFTLCGYTWQLRLFPGGSLEAHKGFISYYLASKSNKIARASYKLVLVNQVIGAQDEVFASSGIRVFEPKGVQVDGWGRDKFIQSNQLKDPDVGFCVDDAVIFKVEIVAFGELEELQRPIDSVVMDSKYATIASAVRHLYNNAIASDVSIIVGDQEVIYAHKCILSARSIVLEMMFTSGMQEGSGREWVLAEYPSDVIHALMRWIYSDELPEKDFLEESGHKLLAVAIKYQIFPLISFIEDFFFDEIQEDNAVAMLQFADAVGASVLKQRTIVFIANHANLILQTKEFQSLAEHLMIEATAVIDSVNKRRGCRGSAEKDKKSASSCIMM